MTPLAEVAVGRVVARVLQPAEPSAEVGERRGIRTGRLLDPGQEDAVGAPDDRFLDLAFEVRERIPNEGYSGPTAQGVDACELVLALLGERVSDIALVFGEDVHAENARSHDRRPGVAGLVQTDQQHRWIHRQRRDRAGRRAVIAVVGRSGDHRYPAGKTADHIAEDVVRDGLASTAARGHCRLLSVHPMECGIHGKEQVDRPLSSIFRPNVR